MAGPFVKASDLLTALARKIGAPATDPGAGILTRDPAAPSGTTWRPLRAVTTLVSGGGVTVPTPVLDDAVGLTLTGDVTLTFPPAATGRTFTLLLRQDSTGGRTVTWPLSVDWVLAAAPTVLPGPNRFTLLQFTCVDGARWTGWPVVVDLNAVAFTDERAQDAAAAMITAGTHVGVAFTYDDAANTLNATVALPPSYTDEQARDAAAALILNGVHTGVTFTYDDAADRLSATVTLPPLTPNPAGTYGTASTVPRTTVDAKGRVTSVMEVAVAVPAAQVAGLADYVANAVPEAARDAVAAMFAKGTQTGVTFTFDDAADRADVTVGGDGLDAAVARYLNLPGSQARNAAQALLGAGAALANTVRVAVSGSTTQGQTLTVSTGTWTAAPDSYTYRWNRDGVAVAGATTRTYATVAADVGHAITATVTARKANYADGASTSEAVVVTAVVTTSSGRLTRTGSKLQVGGVNRRLAGANIYWLGLNDNNGGDQYGTYPSQDTITAALQGARDMGVNLVRAHTVGISAGTPKSFQTGIGTFVHGNLAAADWAVKEAGRLGISLMVPLTDNWNYYHRGKGVFTQWAYQQDPTGLTATPSTVKDDPNERVFFRNTSAGLRVRALFKAYISAWLNHVNPYTGLAYKDDPTIAVVETGNEIYYAAQLGTDEWTQEIASYVKSIAPDKLVADGSAADRVAVATQPGITAAAVDVVGAHYYPQQQSGSYPPVEFTNGSAGYPAGTALQQLAADADAAAAAGKVFVVGEYPWTRSTVGQFYAAVESDQDVQAAMYWSYVAGAETHGGPFGSDDYPVHRPYLTREEQQYAPALATHTSNMSGVPLAGGTGATPAASTNLIVTPALRNASDASLFRAEISTVVTDTAVSKSGGSSLRLTPTGSGVYPYMYGVNPSAWAPVTPGSVYTGFFSFRSMTATTQGYQATFVYVKADGTYIGNATPGSYAAAVQSQWVQCSVTAGTPAGAAYASVQIQAGAPVSSGDVINVDEYGLVAGTSTVWSSSSTGGGTTFLTAEDGGRLTTELGSAITLEQ